MSRMNDIPETVSSEQMGILDKNAQYWGVPAYLLMECAGLGVLKAIKQKTKLIGAKVAVFCGLGNNGGDGFVIARHLAAEGAEVETLLLGLPERIRTEESKKNWAILQNLKSVKSIVIADSKDLGKMQAKLRDKTILVDAMLGTGVKGTLKEPYATAITLFNKLTGLKIAVDLPSGMDPNTGEVSDNAVQADLCVTFHRAKTGLKVGTQYIKELVVSEIGIPPEASLYVGPGDVEAAILRRDKFTHKGLNGKLLVIGGSKDYSGAPSLAALGAQTLGVDLVRIAAPKVVASTIRGYSPTLMVTALPGHYIVPDHASLLKPLIEWADAVVLGPGTGNEDDTRLANQNLIEDLVKTKKPVVIDADALKHAKGHLTPAAGCNVVLTPHAGEFLTLTDVDLPPMPDLEKRKELVSTQAASLGCVILLKGPTDIIASPTATKFNATGVPPMSVGGTGDVLSGIVGALLSQKVDPFRAACVGAFLNGKYGEEAVHTKGQYITAMDLIENAPIVLKRFF
jgi:hydroxyethylthiazole kinase-like uncharacterized protein yjeF